MPGKRPRYSNRSAYLRWCKTCNVPLLGKKCDLCGSKGIAVPISKPGDARFAMEADRRLVIRTIEKLYGSHAKRNINKKIIMLNKTSGIDRADEVIIDGIKTGVLEYDIISRNFKFTPTVEGCAALSRVTKNMIRVISKPKGHLKGKYIDSKDIDPGCYGKYRPNQNAIIRFPDGKIGKGSVKKEISSGDKVLKVLDITADDIRFETKKNSIEKTIKANLNNIRKKEDESISFIKDSRRDYRLPATVAFSGGKDSLVVADLADRSGVDHELIFLDTGIEFPETIQYVKRYQKRTKKKIRLLRSKADIFEETKRNGPPTKDDRWCHRTHKLEPMQEYISLNYPKGTLTFEGKRKYESFSRSLAKPVEKNPSIKEQTSAYPILNWNAMMVWLYIFYRKLAYNPLYDKGLERVGCWMCPAAFECELAEADKMHPELSKRYKDILVSDAKSRGLSRRFVDYGLWRWKEHPRKIIKLAEEKDIRLG